MTFTQIKYFITVAECLSFTEAAKCLFITQPALSRQISAIESELNIKLFVRSKKALKLTPGGVTLYNKLPYILKEYNIILEEARNANNGFDGTLHLGLLDIYDITSLLPPILKLFQKKYPSIQITMKRYSLSELPEKLYDKKMDLILTYGFSLFDKPDLLIENVEKFHSCIMLPINHPLVNKENLLLSDLKNESFVTLAPKECEEGYNFITSLFQKYNISPKLRMVDSMADVLLWVETGNCVAITSDQTIEKNNPAVTFIPIPNLNSHDTVFSWHKENYNPAISLFIEIFHFIGSL